MGKRDDFIQLTTGEAADFLADEATGWKYVRLRLLYWENRPTPGKPHRRAYLPPWAPRDSREVRLMIARKRLVIHKDGSFTVPDQDAYDLTKWRPQDPVTGKLVSTKDTTQGDHGWTPPEDTTQGDQTGQPQQESTTIAEGEGEGEGEAEQEGPPTQKGDEAMTAVPGAPLASSYDFTEPAQLEGLDLGPIWRKDAAGEWQRVPLEGPSGDWEQGSPGHYVNQVTGEVEDIEDDYPRSAWETEEPS